MSQEAFDPFEALGLPRDASDQTIKSTYHALARRYHPNRHHGSEQQKAALSKHFYQIHQAWLLLRNQNNRRRQVELLDLLELHHEMLLRFVDFLDAEPSTEQQHADGKEHGHASDLDGHVSSDADEDLPHVGLHRRQTVLTSDSRSRGTLPVDNDERSRSPSVNGARRRSPRPQSRGLPTLNTTIPDEEPKHTDYFTLRRKKLEKLKRRELQAFQEYRDAMIAKFEAEEEAENLLEFYERAKWKREYFERAPRETTERLKAFQRFMGAIRIFSGLAPKEHQHAAPSFGTLSPIMGPAEKNQFLKPENALSRKNKSVMKRGWSNDISGDQTSSDSDSGSGSATRKISPPGFRFTNEVRGRAPDQDPPRAVPNHTRVNSYPDSPRKIPGRFKLVVRKPTDLKSAAAEHDSSADTASASSRTPSPLPSWQDLSYTIVPASGPAALFNVNADHRTRSPSPGGHHRTHSLPKASPEGHSTLADACQFTTKSIGAAQHHSIPFQNVHVLTPFEKAYMLGSPPDTDADPEVLMERLTKFNVDVAAKYMVKSDILADFNFRLVYNHREVTKQQHQTFIALSYRRKLHVEKHDHHYTLPLEPEIFQAVWDERQDDNEGVWIDQVCIDQDSDMERTVSMSAMDLVYRSARMIVVALDDLELEAHEGDLLQSHMDEYTGMVHVAPRQRFRRKQPPWLESHDELYQVVKKILRSSWFRRAWCRHEMRLAKHHIFLIPCRRPGSWAGRDILRFNGKCIAHLLALSTEVPFEPEVESVKPALYAFFRDRAKMASGETRMRSHHGNFTTVVAEVFAMEAGGDPRIPAEQRESDARKDKIAIILNTMECGLALHQDLRDPAIHFSENECYHDLLLVALAAQDPGALCSVGCPLPASRLATSWLFVPTVADSGLNNFKTLQRIPAETEFVTHTSGSEHYIQLDLKFIRTYQAVHPHEQGDGDRLKLARLFINVCQEKGWGRNRNRYLINDRKSQRLFGPMRDVYVETLACVFACGPVWMSDVSQRYSMSRWRVDLKGAYELMVALQNTMGNWPPHAWPERAAGFIMDFVNFLVIRGLPQRQLSKPENWRPIYVPLPDVPGAKVITFVPVHKNICTAVPTVLANPDYVHLARMWVLEPRWKQDSDRTTPQDVVSSFSEWTLLGRSVVFSDENAIEHMHDIGGDFKTQQRVFGRPLSKNINAIETE